jgi:hypothetical protein
MAGVDHFLLYDNNPEGENEDQQTRAILASYIEEGKVTLIPWTEHDDYIFFLGYEHLAVRKKDIGFTHASGFSSRQHTS